MRVQCSNDKLSQAVSELQINIIPTDFIRIRIKFSAVDSCDINHILHISYLKSNQRTNRIVLGDNKCRLKTD